MSLSFTDIARGGLARALEFPKLLIPLVFLGSLMYIVGEFNLFGVISGEIPALIQLDTNYSALILMLSGFLLIASVGSLSRKNVYDKTYLELFQTEATKRGLIASVLLLAAVFSLELGSRFAFESIGIGLAVLMVLFAGQQLFKAKSVASKNYNAFSEAVKNYDDSKERNFKILGLLLVLVAVVMAPGFYIENVLYEILLESFLFALTLIFLFGLVDDYKHDLGLVKEN